MTKATALLTRGVFAGILLSPAIVSAQTRLPLKHTPKPTTQAITAEDAMTRLYIFADDSMQGRRAGEEGGLKGTAYIEREVRRLGLVPAGDSGTFFQAVPLIMRTVDMTGSLKADDQQVTLGADVLPVGISGIPRSLDGAQVIFAGDATDSMRSVLPAQAVGKVVLVTSSGSAAGQRYPGAVGVITVIQPQQFMRLRGFSSGRSTRMRSDADTVHTRLT